MARIIQSHEILDYEADLNYVPYRYRNRSSSTRKLLLVHHRLSAKGSGIRYESIYPKYVRTYSPPAKKSSSEIFNKYIKSPQEPTRILFGQREDKKERVDVQED